MIECSVVTCDRKAYCRGYCRAHYNRLNYYGDVQEGRPLPNRNPYRQGRFVNQAGYVEVYVGSNTPGSKKDGYMLEHRKIMQDQLGRPLQTHETVHHINGNRQDNRPENLEFRSGPHGPGATGPHCHTCTCFDH